ncbi:MAG: transcription termination/antitermination factor NusG [Synergistes sp.]|nr:transcription termination/antitermination factor NusG [Synergistes sp.]
MSDLFGNTQERRWYIIQTYSGYEGKVKANLDQRIASMHMEDRIFRVVVPKEEKLTIKDGKSKRVTRKIFPCYVFVEMILEDQSWYVVRHTPGVTGFVGSGNHPIPLSKKEAEDITNRLEDKDVKPKVEVDFKIGDMVRVKSNAAAFAGSAGPVVEVDTDKAKIKFRITVFGRETDVEADYNDLEKMI